MGMGILRLGSGQALWTINKPQGWWPWGHIWRNAKHSRIP